MHIGRRELDLIVIALQPVAQSPLGIVNHDGWNTFQTKAFQRPRDFVGQKVMRKVGVLTIKKLPRLLKGRRVVRVVKREGEDLQSLRFVLLREVDNRRKQIEAAPAPAGPNIDNQQAAPVRLDDRCPLFAGERFDVSLEPGNSPRRSRAKRRESTSTPAMTFVSGTSELGIARSRLSILSGDRASIPEPRQNYPRAHKCRGGVKKGNPSIDHHLPGIGEIRLGPKRHRFHAYSGESQIDMRQTPCFHVLLLSKDLVLSPLIFTCNSVLGSVDYDRCTYSTHSSQDFHFWPWHGESIHPRCPAYHVFSR